MMLRERLLKEWLPKGPQICVLEGFSGLGKAALAQELIEASQLTSVAVEAAEGGIGGDDILIEIAIQLEALGDPIMVERADHDLYAALDDVLRKPYLVVILNFDQIISKEDSLPPKNFWNFLNRFGRQTNRQGRLLLVTSQALPEGPWKQHATVKTMQPPDEERAVRLLGELLADRGCEDEIPLERRPEVARWLGRIPRAMEALVECIAEGSSLEELIEMEPDIWSLRDSVVAPQLVASLEIRFLNRTLDRLDPNSLLLLQELSVYRKSFKLAAIQRLRHPPESKDHLMRKFLLGHRLGWFALNPVARELARAQLQNNPSRLSAAHNSAADHYSRSFTAKGDTDASKQGSDFVEARYHLLKVGREQDFEDIAQRFRRGILATYGIHAEIPQRSHELNQLIAVIGSALDGSTAELASLRYFLARLLVARGAQDDDLRALRQATLATKSLNSGAVWLLRIKLAAKREGLPSMSSALRQAEDRLSAGNMVQLYYQAVKEHVIGGKVADALSLLDRAIGRYEDPNTAFTLYQLKATILAKAGQHRRSIKLLRNYIELASHNGRTSRRIAEQALLHCFSIVDTVGLGELRDILAAKGWSQLELFSRILLAQCNDTYADIVGMDEQARTYPAAAMQVAFAHLCAGFPRRASATLIASNVLATNRPSAWICALIAYCNGELEAAALALEKLLGRSFDQEEVDDKLLMHEWSLSGTGLESYPAFYFPRLPASMTGLEFDITLSTYQQLTPDELATVSFPRISPLSGPYTDVGEAATEASGIHVQVSPTFSMISQVSRSESSVSETYNIGQAGAAGHGAQASNMQFSQNLVQGVDATGLADELKRLRDAMRGSADSPEHDLAIAEVAQAEVAVRKGDSDAARSHLKRAGEWALSTANAIGVALASAWIKSSLGM